ncbi:hypothetical protein MMC20_001587 [Loxospora ochrophaea]|nr:hypothetical protein [Loxospora ochrophaea]
MALPLEIRTQGTKDDKEVEFVFKPYGEPVDSTSLPGILTILHNGIQLGEPIFCKDVIAIVPQGEHNLEAPLYHLLHMKTKLSTSGNHCFDFFVERVAGLPDAFHNNFLVPSCPSHLSVPKGHQEEPNVHIICSTRSGACAAEALLNGVLKHALSEFGLFPQDYKIYMTTSETSISEYATTTLLPCANKGVAQTVLLLSGDGGVVDIINTLLSSTQSQNYIKPVIGIAGMGTGNALANSTGLNKGSTYGLASFFKGSPHSLPTLSARFSPESELLIDEGRGTQPLRIDDPCVGVVYGAVVCSWALHASLVADSDTTEYRKHGAQRFQMAAKELLAPSDGSRPHVYAGKITLTKRKQNGDLYTHVLDRREHMYILVTLVSNLQEKLNISPYSKPLDGQLRLLHLGPLPSDEIMRILGLAFADGEHVKESIVVYEEVEGFRIDFEESDSRWRRVCVDGKIIKVDEGGWVEVRRVARDVVDVVASL